jgi:purine-binding chemotaxis protein CheW
MIANEKFLVFGLNGNRFAISLAVVERVVRVAEITPVPDPPAGIRGVINVAGQITPVMDLRQQLHLAEAEIEISDYLILIQSNQGRIALLVNEVLWIIERSRDDIVPADNIFSGLSHIRGAIKVGGEIVLLHDVRLDHIRTLDLAPVEVQQ